MSTETQSGPLNCLGMGGTWAHVGNVHRKANWTANVQAGMCTRVAHGVSVTLFLPNCATRQTGQRRVHGAMAAAHRAGMGNSWDVTDGSAVCAWVDGDCSSVSSVRVRLRLHVVWAWETWAWKRRGAADGTSARAWDEQDLVRVVCLAALVRDVCAF